MKNKTEINMKKTRFLTYLIMLLSLSMILWGCQSSDDDDDGPVTKAATFSLNKNPTPKRAGFLITPIRG